MNFEFVKRCKLEDPLLQKWYEMISADLEHAQRQYYRNPRESGILLRGVTTRICYIYDRYYEIGFGDQAALEEFLNYTGNEGHNVMVSRFLSVVRKEQRDRLNKLRVLGDDCIQGEAAPDQGMSLEDRMQKNAKRMMETMMEAVKDMCQRINKLEDIQEECFLEDALPEPREPIAEELSHTGEKKSWFGHIFSGKR